MTPDDTRHIQGLFNLVDEAKRKGYALLIHGALPDSGDSYTLATDNVLITDDSSPEE